VGRVRLLVQHRDGAGYKIDGHDIDFIRGAEGKRRQSRQENKRADHIELVGFRAAAVTKNDARTEDRALNVRQQLPHHVLAEFLRARVRIVVRTIPVDRRVFLDHFVRALASHSHRAHVTEAAQAVIFASAHRELYHFQGAAQVHIEAALLGFAIERGRAVNHRVRGARETPIIVIGQPELGSGEIAAENVDPAIQIGLEAGKIQVQLQRMPKAFPRFLVITRAHK